MKRFTKTNLFKVLGQYSNKLTFILRRELHKFALTDQEDAWEEARFKICHNLRQNLNNLKLNKPVGLTSTDLMSIFLIFCSSFN